MKKKMNKNSPGGACVNPAELELKVFRCDFSRHKDCELN